MSGFLSSLIDNWQDALDRHRNRPFLEAAMAACAVIATDDGTVSFAERVRVDQILETCLVGVDYVAVQLQQTLRERQVRGLWYDLALPSGADGLTYCR